jgi:hypothetical protein
MRLNTVYGHISAEICKKAEALYKAEIAEAEEHLAQAKDQGEAGEDTYV